MILISFAICKAMVKQATKMCNLFYNIAAKWVKKLCCRFYHQHSNLSGNRSGSNMLQVEWILTSNIKDNITQESSLTQYFHHLLQNKFALSQ